MGFPERPAMLTAANVSLADLDGDMPTVYPAVHWFVCPDRMRTIHGCARMRTKESEDQRDIPSGFFPISASPCGQTCAVGPARYVCAVGCRPIEWSNTEKLVQRHVHLWWHVSVWNFGELHVFGIHNFVITFCVSRLIRQPGCVAGDRLAI